MADLLPSVVLIGRPNVGKSTLFNRLTRSRDALVADLPGLTRDRHFGTGRVGERPYLVVDTGGFEPLIKDGILRAMAKQSEMAIMEADAVIFVVDARNGLTPHDKEIANLLRRHPCSVFVAVNKAEGQNQLVNSEFYEMGYHTLYPISASHGDGVKALMTAVLASLPQDATDTENDADAEQSGEEAGSVDADHADNSMDSTKHALSSARTPAKTPAAEYLKDNQPVRVAIVGRPNVGKSTFINSLLGEDRLVAFDQPGTTRDAISVEFTKNGRPYTLIDTAGIRRKGKVFEAIEKFSVVKTLQAITAAHVVILMVDARQDIADQDASIADFILSEGRALVLAVNKWDNMNNYDREQVKIDVARKLRFIDFAEPHFISAKEGTGLNSVFRAVDAAFAAATKKLPTPQLTRVLQEALARQAPKRHGLYRPKPRYAHQGGQNPPIIVIHGTGVEHIDSSYRRYLQTVFRDAFQLHGTPLRLQFVGTDNPHAPKS